VGTPLLNRPSKQFKQTLGLFMHMVPLRLELTPEETFESLIGKVNGEMLETMRHQRYATGNRAGRRAYDVVFNYEIARVGDFSGMPARVESVFKGNEEDSLSMLVRDYEASGSFQVDIDYHCDVFEEVERERLYGYWIRVVDAFIENPEGRLSEVSLLSAEEREHLIEGVNGTKRRAAAGEWVLEGVERQARERAEAVAVVYEDQHLSYGELNLRANRLAHHLQGLGVGPEVPAGLMMSRSLEMVVGLLGIVKSGGGYVPLDPAYPAARLARMVETSRAGVVVTERSLRAGLAAGVEPVSLEDVGGESRTENPGRRVEGENLAYVIFTSGSTGAPHAVAVSHGALSHYTEYAGRRYGIESWDRVLQFASLSFDTSAEEIFPALSAGSTLVVRNDEMLESSRRFLASCEGWGVTVLDLPTAYWQQVVSDVGADRALVGESLRLVIVGGERVAPGPVASWKEKVGERARLWNTYGPTEATVVSTTCELSEGKLGGEVPIGRPIDDVRVYVLDGELDVVPEGVCGELFIGGRGLARGYLEEPALTASKFLPSPFGKESGARVYRSGDRCRWRRDGNLEYAGRVDHQVKLRGYRVELGEVQAVLESHPSVEEAVVTLGGEGVEARLLGYCVYRRDGAEERVPTVAELRSYVGSRLPEYMVPSTVVRLSRLPLTPSGKVDRRALPAPEVERSQAAHVGPRTPMERKLAAIWSEVLGVDRVGIHDDFFELGGHSLLVIQVYSRVKEELGTDVSLRRFFELPTIAGLAEAIPAERMPEAPPLRPVPRDRPLPLSFAQQRLWFLDQLMPNSPLFNVPVAARIHGSLSVPAAKKSLNEIVRRHETLRTTFAMDSEPVQVIAPFRASVALPLVELGALSEAARESEATRLAREDASRPFDLSRGPLLRVRLLRLGERDHVVSLTMHHIVSDGWSAGILLHELETLYSAFSEGKGSPLPELPIQYADFAHWERQWLSGEPAERQLSYWKKQLAHLPALKLPTDFPRPSQRSLRGATRANYLEADLSKTLHAFSGQQGITLFMLFLAAFQTLLSREAGARDIVVGTDVANRSRTEVEALIGFFTNQLVLRTDLSGNPTFEEILRRVREVTLDAYAHQELPFNMLVEELAPKRDSGRVPLFQVKIEFQHVETPETPPEGLSFAPLGLSPGVSRDELHLSVRSVDGELFTSLTYSTDLFEDATIQRMLAHLETILRTVAERPQVRLSELEDLLAGLDRRRERRSADDFEKTGLRLLKSLRQRTSPKETRTTEENP
jgi:amino acid adenylation domain-containing protein